MCDYSLNAVKSRPAKVADRLQTQNFGTGTTGFSDINPGADPLTAVCVMPGTELAFDDVIKRGDCWGSAPVDLGEHKTAIFRQVEKDRQMTHHDTLELPDGQKILLTYLAPGQRATVLQLPAAPKTKEEAEEQTRAEFVG